MKSIGDKLIDPAVERIRKLPFKHMLILLLGTDLFFISLHILRSLPGIDLISAPEDSAFSISHDLGLGEAFQYIKELWMASPLGVLVFHYGKKRI
jgi:hypothetical protein